MTNVTRVETPELSSRGVPIRFAHRDDVAIPVTSVDASKGLPRPDYIGTRNDGKRRVVVLGKGNLLLKDEGVGIHAIETLRKDPRLADSSVEIVDGATLPDLAACLDDAGTIDKLVVVDAVSSGNKPGTVYRFRPEQADIPVGRCDSLHETSLLESLRLLELRGLKPAATVIIGIEAGEVEWGLELSPEVKERIPRVIELILSEVQTGADCEN